MIDFNETMHEQQLYDGIFILLKDSMKVLPFNPRTPEHGIYVVMGTITTDYNLPKTQVTGEITVTLDIYGNEYQRWDVTNTAKLVYNRLYRGVTTPNYKFNLDMYTSSYSTELIDYDDHTETHGIVTLTFNF